MKGRILLGLVLCGLTSCGGPRTDERHLDGIELANARIREFRERFGADEEVSPVYVLGVPIYQRHRFRLRPEDARRISGSARGPLFVDEGSSHNAIRVWLPLPRWPKSYADAREKWDIPRRYTTIESSVVSSLPLNLVGMNYAEFEVGDMEVGLFFDGEESRIACITWASALKSDQPLPSPGPEH